MSYGKIQDIYNIQVYTVFTLHSEEPGDRFTILTVHCTAPKTCKQWNLRNHKYHKEKLQ